MDLAHDPAGDPMRVPLVVDLDGTLLMDDTMLLMLRGALRHPAILAGFARRARRSRAAAKWFLWDTAPLDMGRLRFSPTLLTHLRAESSRGRPLVLATGAPEPLAHEIASQVGLFDTVAGSSPSRNLTSSRKADRLISLFGVGGFDYAGNAMADVAIWKTARAGIVCNAPRSVHRAAISVCTIVATIDDRRFRGPTLQALISALVR